MTPSFTVQLSNRNPRIRIYTAEFGREVSIEVFIEGSRLDRLFRCLTHCLNEMPLR